MKRLTGGYFSRRGGFSLVELMIVLVIVTILAALAIPAYRDQVRRANRAQARAALLQAAQFMQRFHATHDRFDRRSDTSASDDAVVLPQSLQGVPAEGAPSYRLSLLAVDPVSYVLAATPSGVMADDPCGTLTLTHTGVHGASGAQADRCWR